MDNKKIIVKRTGRYGKGVFAIAPIKKGELVAEFDGKIYSSRSNKWNNYLYNHAIQFEPKKWRDAKGIATMLNHSCEPNCGIRNLFQLVAMRGIAVGEELTWDYEMTEDHDYWRMQCRCNTASCRKVIGAYRNMPPEVRRRYGRYISKWLRDYKR